MNNPHVWTMYKMEAYAQAALASLGIAPTISPHCRYCGITSLEAQRTQPETMGVGPCPKRKDNEGG